MRPHIPPGLRRVFATAAATGFLAWTAAGLFLAVIPVVLQRAADIENLALTGGILGSVMACSVLTQPLVARCDARAAQLLGLGFVLGALGALALTGGDSASATMTAAVATGVGHGLAYGGATAAIDAAAPGDQRAAISSALYVAFYLGAGIPAVGVGVLTLWFPLTTAISWLSGAAAAFLPLVGVAVVCARRAPRAALATTHVS